jgi:glycerophosphoryl diester phosphodiesterase
MAHRPGRIIGHRGAALNAPENTLAGFQRAAREGARWIETDAKLTADNAVILLHDDTLERTTNGHGPVAKATLSQIRALDAGSWFGPAFAGARVPTLDEALAAIRQLDLGCNLEIKPCPGREIETAEIVMRELEELWPQEAGRPLVSSFSREALRVARRLRPDWPLGVLFDDEPKDWLDWALEIGAVSVHCWHKTLTPAWASAIKERGYGLLVYTVNEPDLARLLFEWGADAVFTDAPGRLLEAGLG